MRHFLEFEKPIAELEAKIEELRRATDAGGIDVAGEVGKLGDKAKALLRQTYARLSPWQKTLVARHPERPKALDYVLGLIAEWTPPAGDRAFADDAAVVAGLGRFRHSATSSGIASVTAPLRGKARQPVARHRGSNAPLPVSTVWRRGRCAGPPGPPASR